MEKQRKKLIDEYFEQIRIRKVNLDALNDVLGLAYEEFLKGFVSRLMAPYENWELEYILEKDIEEYCADPNAHKYTTHMLIKYDEDKWYGSGNEDPSNVNKAAFLAKRPLLKLDMDAATNLIQFRIIRNWRNLEIFKKNPRELKEFIINLRDFRNSFSHESKTNPDTFKDNDYVEDLMQKQIDGLARFVSTTYEVLKNGKDLQGLFEDTREKWLCIKEAFHYARFVQDIKKNDGMEVTLKDIFNYKIYFGYSAFRSKYRNILDDLIISGVASVEKKLVIDDASIQWIRGEAKKLKNEGKIKEETLLNEFIGKLNRYLKQGLVQPLRSTGDDGVESFPEEMALKHIQNDSGGKWCVITEEGWIANAAWNLPHQNVIAVKIRNEDQLEVFAGEPVSSQSNIKEAEALVEPLVNIEFISEPQEGHRGEPIAPEEENFEPEDIPPEDNFDTFSVSEKERKSVFSQEMPIREKDITQEDQIRQKKIETPGLGDMVYYGDPKNMESKVTLEELRGEGGEGDIFYYGFAEKYIKIYHSNVLTTKRIQKIEFMLELEADLPEEICWPKEKIYNLWGDIVGFSMPCAGYKKNAPNKLLGSVADICNQLRSSATLDEKEWSRSDLLTVCINIAALFKRLHQCEGILMGDVNPENILIDQDLKVYFIDVDSFQVGKYACPVGRPEFTSPALYKRMGKKISYSENLRTLDDECFASAVLYFYILFLGEFPYEIDLKNDARTCIENGIYRFEVKDIGKTQVHKRNYIWMNLSEQLQHMFEDAFGKNHKIYSDQEWEAAFLEMRRETSMGDDTKYSNEVNPSAYKENESDHWTKITCTLCGKEFLAVKEDDTWCPSCLMEMKLAKMKIHRVRCKKCKKLWTVNEWDADGADSDNMLCPDCDPDFKYDKRYQTFSDDFKAAIEMAGSYALKQYKKYRRNEQNDVQDS